MSFDDDESPIADRTGERCGAGQSGDVWFLAGTYGSRPVERKCTVPAGKHLFFPVITYVVWPNSCGRGCSGCKDLTATAKAQTDDAEDLHAELDGKPLADLASHRLVPESCFKLPVSDPPPWAASNGYWLALKPLPKGTHTLRIGGTLPTLRQQIRYTLIVQ